MASSVLCETPIGKITITEEDGAIIALDFGAEIASSLQETPLLQQASTELAEFFAGERKNFALPLRPAGTAFQQKVWAALLEIPYGQTRSYGQIAAAIGNGKACRAVGMANHRNPIPILIPCHRVIGSDGSLTGYGGGMEIKRILLDMEKIYR